MEMIGGARTGTIPFMARYIGRMAPGPTPKKAAVPKNFPDPEIFNDDYHVFEVE